MPILRKKSFHCVRPVSDNRTGGLDNTIIPDGVYKLVRRYALALGLKIGAHAFQSDK